MITVKMPHNKQEKFESLRDLKSWAREVRTRSPKTTNGQLLEALDELNTRRKEARRPALKLHRKGDGWVVVTSSGKEKYIERSREVLSYLEGQRQGLSASAN